MKILLVSSRFPPFFGGTATTFYGICNRLDSKEIVVLTQTIQGYKEFDKKQGFKIYRTKKVLFDENKNSLLNDLKVYFRSWLRIKKIVKTENIDVVLCESYLTGFPLVFTGIPYYVWCHGEEISSDLGRFARFMKEVTLRRAKGLISISDYTMDLIKKYNSNLKTIYSAVDLEEFKVKSKSRKLIKKHKLKNKKILFTLSRLEKRKGHEKVINILPRIIEKQPNIKYLIAGSGSEEENLKKQVDKLKLNKYVEFLGKIPQEQLIDYYNLCDIFIMPNRTLGNGDTEGFGTAFLEAQACGKPVIGGNAGGVPSAIKDGYSGFLVDGYDEDDIYEKTMKLLQNNKLRIKMGKNALKWGKKFTYERIIKNMRKFMKFNEKLTKPL